MNTCRTIELARLVAEHIDLPHRVASTVYPRVRPHVELEELVSLGNQGLAEAAQRYDARLGRFETFAWWRVHGAIVDGLRKLVPVPRQMWRDVRKTRAANEERGRGRADADAVCAALAASRHRRPVSLEQVRDEDGGYAGCDAAMASAEEAIDRARVEAGLREAIAALPEAERRLVERHYWGGCDLREAGEELGVSKSWASRLHARALVRLREVMAERAVM